MTIDDPRDDIPAADRTEQARPVVPDEAAEPEQIEIDPLTADEADQVEQAQPVPEGDEEYDRP